MTQSEFEELEEMPVIIRRLAEGLNDEEARRKPAADAFSVVENVCHLRDIEVDGYAERIKRMLSEEEPFLPDLNGAQLAVERRYNEQELSAALDAFAAAREGNLLILKGLTPDQLARRGNFEQSGAITLSRLLEMMREHDAAHLDELRALRRTLDRVPGSSGVASGQR
ncbi:MAG: DinB family protein [Acidobacteria bacterium]|nr:DinB family protein [Acidobacteriota bacterium]